MSSAQDRQAQTTHVHNLTRKVASEATGRRTVSLVVLLLPVASCPQVRCLQCFAVLEGPAFRAMLLSVIVNGSKGERQGQQTKRSRVTTVFTRFA